MDLYNRNYEFLKLSIESGTFFWTVKVNDNSGNSIYLFDSGRYFYLKIDLMSDTWNFKPPNLDIYRKIYEFLKSLKILSTYKSYAKIGKIRAIGCKDNQP